MIQTRWQGIGESISKRGRMLTETSGENTVGAIVKSMPINCGSITVNGMLLIPHTAEERILGMGLRYPPAMKSTRLACAGTLLNLGAVLCAARSESSDIFTPTMTTIPSLSKSFGAAQCAT